jgi:hypothetical protein
MSIGLTGRELCEIEIELKVAQDQMSELADQIEGWLDKVGGAICDEAKSGWFRVLRDIVVAIGDTAGDVSMLCPFDSGNEGEDDGGEIDA